uniref:WAP domain-containing protein n=1 Tax=Prolemur simus TaxID=1328070 RepID=A0A8C9AEF2_PROSS
MRCLLSLALALLTLEVALAQTLTHLPVLCAGQAVCPEASASEEVSCAKTCLSDQECLGNSKCCPSACGRSCRTPIIGNHKRALRTPLLPQSCKEQNECSVDSQCSSNKKCCFSRCAMRCLDPVLGMPPGDPWCPFSLSFLWPVPRAFGGP